MAAVLKPADLGVAITATEQTVAVTAPPKRKAGQKVKFFLFADGQASGGLMLQVLRWFMLARLSLIPWTP